MFILSDIDVDTICIPAGSWDVEGTRAKTALPSFSLSLCQIQLLGVNVAFPSQTQQRLPLEVLCDPLREGELRVS